MPIPDSAPIRLIDLGKTDPWRSQAVYHALAGDMTSAGPDTILLARPASPYLCIGLHQSLDAVLDTAACQRLGLPVLRRRVGGGATYLDENQLFYQFVFHHSRAPANFRRCYAHLLAGPVAALNRFSLPCQLKFINELEVEGKRVAGIGGGRIGEASVVVGNFLFDFDYDAMCAVWRAPWPAFRELAAMALRERVGTLRGWRKELTAEDVQPVLVEEMGKALGRPLIPGALTPEEEARSRPMGAWLSSPEFLQLHNDPSGAAMTSLKISSRGSILAREAWAGARSQRIKLRISLYVLEETIAAVRIDSGGEASWCEAERELTGIPLASFESRLAKITSGNGPITTD